MHKRNGFTIVEAAVALVVAVVVLGGALGLVTGVRRMAMRSDDRQDPRERAHVALAQVRLALMDAWSYEVADDGATLRFRTPRFSGELSREPGTGALILKTRSGERRALGAKVASFTARELSPGLVRVELELKRPRSDGAPHALGDLRMAQEILVPTVALRDPAIPVRDTFDPAA